MHLHQGPLSLDTDISPLWPQRGDLCTRQPLTSSCRRPSLHVFCSTPLFYRGPYQQTACWHPSQNPVLHPRLLCSVLSLLCLKSPYRGNGYNNRTPFMGLLQGNELTHAQVLEHSLPSSPYTVPVHPSFPSPPCSLPSPLSLFLPLPFSPSLLLPFLSLFSFFLPPFLLSFFILNY